MWRRLFAKIVVKVTGPEAIMACQDDQLCARLKAGIDGAINGVQSLWYENSSTEECFFNSYTQGKRSTGLIASEFCGR